MVDTCTSKDKSPKENEEEYHTDLDAMSVTVFDEENVVRLYPEAPTPEIAEKGQCAVVSKNSRLRDAIIMEFHALETCRKTKRIPLDAVKARLRAVARRMLVTK